jgi:hypothetical protein
LLDFLDYEIIKWIQYRICYKIVMLVFKCKMIILCKSLFQNTKKNIFICLVACTPDSFLGNCINCMQIQTSMKNEINSYT